jgi:hypothetical protein
MIQVVDKPYFIPRNDVDTQFEGRTVLLIFNSDNTESGLLAAYSDGNADTVNEDFDSLFEILMNQYNGQGKIISGYIYDGSELVCI